MDKKTYRLSKIIIIYEKMIFNIKSFFSNLKRSLSWFFYMWDNKDSDSVYLFYMIEKKLKDMVVFFNKKPEEMFEFLNKKKIIEQITTTLYYLNRVQDKIGLSSIEYPEYKKLIKKWGSLNIVNLEKGKLKLGREKVKTEKDRKAYLKEIKTVFDRINKKEEKEKAKFFECLKENYKYWSF
jgi:hypothetical protein